MTFSVGAKEMLSLLHTVKLVL